MNTAIAAHARAKILSFIARDIAGAVAEIRARLGPDAVILNIRRLPGRGLSRLWQHPRIEVLACLPDAEDAPFETARQAPAADAPAPSQAPRRSVSHQEAMQRYAQGSALAAGAVNETPAPIEVATLPSDPATAARHPGQWRCAAVLERLGLLPLHAERVLDQMQKLHGADRQPPESMRQELALAREALLKLWRPRPAAPSPGGAPGNVFRNVTLCSAAPSPGGAPLHVFIGPHGSGKSTVLCKWLAQTVLLESQSAHVWRLDCHTANTSELVNIYGEILGVRVERSWHGRGDSSLPGFVDLPGADFHDEESSRLLKRALEQFPGAQVHLVLNAAYTVPLLLIQTRAFSTLPVSDLILTHLDEETAWSKLWNLVLGTNFPLGFLSAGQNIPGRFCVAQPELLCGSLFGAK